MTIAKTRISWVEELQVPRAAVIAIFVLPFVIAALAHYLALTQPYVFMALTHKAFWFSAVPPRGEADEATMEEFRQHHPTLARVAQFGPSHVSKMAVELVTALFAVLIYREARRRGRAGLAKLYLVMAIGLAAVIGEEARWGHSFGLHLFPEKIVQKVEKTNKQKEFTLHNQPVVQGLIKNAMSALALYCLVAGALAARRQRAWFQEKALFYFIPHPVLFPGFAFLLFYSLERLGYKLLTGHRVYGVWTQMQEPAELVAVMTLMFFCWLALRAVKRWPAAAHA